MITFIFNSQEDSDKFVYFYNKYNKALYYKAIELLGNITLAEDAVQNTFLSVSKNMYKLDVNDDSRSYAYFKKTLLHICFAESKKNKNEEYYEDLDSLIIDDTPSISDDVIKSIDIDLLKNNLSLLKDEYRQILVLKYFYGYTEKQIAKELNLLNVNYVSVKIYRAKKKLAKMLLNGGYSHDAETFVK